MVGQRPHPRIRGADQGLAARGGSMGGWLAGSAPDWSRGTDWGQS